MTPAGSAIPSSRQIVAPSTSSTRRPAHERRIDALDRHAERGLELSPLLELGEPAGRRREEEVADLLEERLAELLEEPHARLREPHLGRGRELLPDAAHRLAGRAAGDLPDVREHDPVRAPQREVVGDRGADRARARYDDSSHPRSSSRSPSVSWRRGRPHVLAHRHAAQAEHELQRRMAREALDRRPQLPELGRADRRRLADDRGHPLRERRREAGDRARRARGEPVEDERLRPDEDVEPLEQVRREPFERRVGDLQPREVRRLLTQLCRAPAAAPRSRSRARTRRRRTEVARRRPPRP